MSDFEGLVAIVTGGAGAIGLATAKLLHSRGAKVAAVDLKPDGLPNGILGIAADVTDDAQVKSAVDAVVERFGRLDVVVNNAGIPAVGDVAENSDDEWLRVLDVNVVGMVRVARHALPHLRRSPAAAIVNTCSIVAWAGLEKRALYSKYASHELHFFLANLSVQFLFLALELAALPVEFLMNGEEFLPAGHGAPLRVRIPRQLGGKSTKYLSWIRVTDTVKDIGRGFGAGGVERGFSWYAGI